MLKSVRLFQSSTGNMSDNTVDKKDHVLAYKLFLIRTDFFLPERYIWNYSVEHFVYLNITQIKVSEFSKRLKRFLALFSAIL